MHGFQANSIVDNHVFTGFYSYYRILLPIVADRVLYLILPGGSSNKTESRSSISTFGFLYGTFPTAPTVFVFSNHYNIAMDVVSNRVYEYTGSCAFFVFSLL